MRHVLVATTRRHQLADELREASDGRTTFLSVKGIEATLERIGRSARLDAIVTDDPGVFAAIRSEIPGEIPVVLAADDEGPHALLESLDGNVTA
ncbi:MAG TPA: hypothetical protein VL084_15560 [Thermoanaerobaculia bacterium]|nr:hypothetical protein [Thermoanaerobaculia bacterium]